MNYSMNVVRPEYAGGEPYSPMWAWDKHAGRVAREWPRPKNWRNMHAVAKEFGLKVEVPTTLSCHRIYFESLKQAEDFMVEVDLPQKESE